jgi:DNA-binding transcriptional regulator YdaS (Cro superfamily)
MMTDQQRDTAEKALASAIAAAGHAGHLAKELGITRQAVHQWTVCPPERAFAVEKITGVSAHTLRPDYRRCTITFDDSGADIFIPTDTLNELLESVVA